MATNTEVLLTWTFMSKAKPEKELLSILTEGEEIYNAIKL